MSRLLSQLLAERSVDSSVIFRNVTVAPGAVIRNSVVFQGCVIEEGVELDNVILDKDVHIRAGKKLIGQPTYPVVIVKGALI